MREYGTLTYDKDGRRWQINAEPDVARRLKRIFPRVDLYAKNGMRVSDTPDVAHDLVMILGRWPLTMDAATERYLLERHASVLESERAVRDIMDGMVPDRGFQECERPLRDYQEVAAQLMMERGSLLLADVLGAGKTSSFIGALRDPRFLPCLVVCPTHLPHQWKREINTVLPWLKVHIGTKGTAYNLAARCNGYTPDVLILNYAKLRGWGLELAGKMRSVCFDEAQELRNNGSDKYNAAYLISEKAELRAGLTGTPIMNYGGDMFNVMQCIDPDILGDRAEFMREWCHGNGNKISVTDPAAFGLFLREQGVFLRRTLEEIGRELPDVSRISHVVDLDSDTLDKLTGDEAVGLAEAILSKENKPFERMQAAGDFDWRLRHATGVAKAPYVAAFTRMLLDQDEPVVLLGWHRDCWTMWAESLKAYDPAFFTGHESGKQKQDNAEAFMRGDTNLLCMSLRSAAGLDGLQERCRTVVFGELDWSPGIHDQAIGRVHRDGQTKPVLAYFLYAEEGSDPVVMEALNLKRMQSDPVNDPSLPLFAPVTDQTDRVKQLAQEFLARQQPKLRRVT